MFTMTFLPYTPYSVAAGLRDLVESAQRELLKHCKYPFLKSASLAADALLVDTEVVSFVVFPL